MLFKRIRPAWIERCLPIRCVCVLFVSPFPSRVNNFSPSRILASSVDVFIRREGRLRLAKTFLSLADSGSRSRVGCRVFVLSNRSGDDVSDTPPGSQKGEDVDSFTDGICGDTFLLTWGGGDDQRSPAPPSVPEKGRCLFFFSGLPCPGVCVNQTIPLLPTETAALSRRLRPAVRPSARPSGLGHLGILKSLVLSPARVEVDPHHHRRFLPDL